MGKKFNKNLLQAHRESLHHEKHGVGHRERKKQYNNKDKKDMNMQTEDTLDVGHGAGGDTERGGKQGGAHAASNGERAQHLQSNPKQSDLWSFGMHDSHSGRDQPFISSGWSDNTQKNDLRGGTLHAVSQIGKVNS